MFSRHLIYSNKGKWPPEVQGTNEVSLKMILFKSLREFPQGGTGNRNLVKAPSWGDGAEGVGGSRRLEFTGQENWRGENCIEKKKVWNSAENLTQLFSRALVMIMIWVNYLRDWERTIWKDEREKNLELAWAGIIPFTLGRLENLITYGALSEYSELSSFNNGNCPGLNTALIPPNESSKKTWKDQVVSKKLNCTPE